MRLPGKRAIIPCVLICAVACLYLLFRLLLSGAYVSSSVLGLLSKQFACRVEIAGATLSLRGLTIRDLSLSYPKADRTHEVARVGVMTVGFHPYPFFKTGVFDRLEMDDVALSIAWDSEGWLTLGRVVSPYAMLAAKSFPIEARRVRICAGERAIPVESALLLASASGGKVNLELKGATILKGAAVGKGWFSVEEDPTMEMELQTVGIDLAEVAKTTLPDDVALGGALSSRISIKGRASSPALLEPGSRVTIEKLSVGMAGQAAIFQSSEAATVWSRGAGSSPAEMKITLGDSTLDAAPWIHLRDTPDCRRARERMQRLFDGCPDFTASVSGPRLRVLYEAIPFAFGAFSGSVRICGDTIAFKDVRADLAGGVLQASWRGLGEESEPRFEGEVALKGVQIAGVLEGTSLRGRKTRGVLSGGLRFTSAATGGAKGEGKMEISDADLWLLPLMEGVARAARLGKTLGGKGVLKAEFVLAGDVLRFGKIEYYEPGLSITGTGDIRLSGEADLSLRLAAASPHARNVPVIDDVAGLVGDAFAAKPRLLRATGPFVSPTVAEATDQPPAPAKATP